MSRSDLSVVTGAFGHKVSTSLTGCWSMAAPASALAQTVLSFNFLGDACETFSTRACAPRIRQGRPGWNSIRFRVGYQSLLIPVLNCSPTSSPPRRLWGCDAFHCVERGEGRLEMVREGGLWTSPGLSAGPSHRGLAFCVPDVASYPCTEKAVGEQVAFWSDAHRIDSG